MVLADLWACARFDLRLSDAEFLAIAPAALDALMERYRIARDEGRWLAGGIRSDIWNVNRDPEKSKPLTAAHFVPGAKTPEDEDREFLEKVVNGERFESPDEEELRRFRSQMGTTFANHGVQFE